MLNGPFTKLQRPPEGTDPRQWSIWYDRIFRILSGVPGIAWDIVSKVGSKLSEIEDRPHADLQEIKLADEESTNTDGDKHVSDFLMNLNKLHREDETIHHTFEQIQDDTASFIDVGVNLTKTYDDAGNKLTIAFDNSWNDVYPSSVTVGVGGIAPSFTAFGGTNLKAYEFTGGISNKEIHLGWQIPHDYKEGTSVTPHVHLFAVNNGTGGTITFDLEYSWCNVDDTGTETTATASGTVTLPADSTTYRHFKLFFGSITGTGKKISSVFDARLVRRQDTDTFTGSVWLKSADIHYQQDTNGSRTAAAK